MAEADDRPGEKPSATGASERRRPVTLDLSAKEVGRKAGAETAPEPARPDTAKASPPSGTASKPAPTEEAPIPSAFAPGTGAPADGKTATGKPASAGVAASSTKARSTAPLIAGFVLAAILGGAVAVGALYLLGRQGIVSFGGRNEATEAAIEATRRALARLSADVAGTPRDMGTLRDELATLKSAVEGLRAAGTGGADALDSIAALQARIDALEAAPGDTGAAELAGRVEALSREVANISASAAQGIGGADLSPRLNEIAGRLDALEARPSPDVAGLETRIGDLSARLDAVQTDAAGFASAAARLDALALHAAVADTAVAFEEGRPFAAEIEALATLGADPALVETLRRYAQAGTPQPTALAAEFDAALAALPAETPAPAASGAVDRLLASARGLVEVRRSGAPAALADAAEKVRAHLAESDHAGALQAWETLPQDAKDATRSFADQLRIRIDAAAALEALRQSALVAISGRSG